MSQSTDPLTNLSRRQLLQAAGGVTLLTLVPRLASADADIPVYELPSDGQLKTRPPVFTALPYLQPGPSSSKLVEGSEAIVIAWQTDDLPAKFEVLYGEHSYDHSAKITSVTRLSYGKDDGESRINYTASLTGLILKTGYRYRVSLNGTVFMEGYFTTRKPRGVKSRFVAFGDNSFGDISDRDVYRYLRRFFRPADDSCKGGAIHHRCARHQPLDANDVIKFFIRHP